MPKIIIIPIVVFSLFISFQKSVSASPMMPPPLPPGMRPAVLQPVRTILQTFVHAIFGSATKDSESGEEGEEEEHSAKKMRTDDDLSINLSEESSEDDDYTDLCVRELAEARELAALLAQRELDTFPLLRLPPEILAQVLRGLSPQDRNDARSVCNTLRYQVDDLRAHGVADTILPVENLLAIPPQALMELRSVTVLNGLGYFLFDHGIGIFDFSERRFRSFPILTLMPGREALAAQGHLYFRRFGVLLAFNLEARTLTRVLRGSPSHMKPMRTDGNVVCQPIGEEPGCRTVLIVDARSRRWIEVGTTSDVFDVVFRQGSVIIVARGKLYIVDPSQHFGNQGQAPTRPRSMELDTGAPRQVIMQADRLILLLRQYVRTINLVDGSIKREPIPPGQRGVPPVLLTNGNDIQMLMRLQRNDMATVAGNLLLLVEGEHLVAIDARRDRVIARRLLGFKPDFVIRSGSLVLFGAQYIRNLPLAVLDINGYE